ncbi:unannotated protein [freshwater metagenome]|uniref:Unannotated protein n=1 Tax=freshwater metagenome TaxID=449393 RepID=A0A6J6JXM4_9ZZZZ
MSEVSETFAVTTSTPVNAAVVGVAVSTEVAKVGLVENSTLAVVLRFSGLIAILITALELVTASSDLYSTVGAA